MFLLINLLVGLAVDLVTWVMNKDEGYANQGLHEAKWGGTFGQVGTWMLVSSPRTGCFGRRSLQYPSLQEPQNLPPRPTL